MHKEGVRKFAMVTTEDEWTVSVSDGFRKAVKELPGSAIQFDELILPTEFDFRSNISKLKQGEFDGIFVNLGLGQLGIFFRQMRELGVKSSVFSNFWIQKKEVIDNAEGAAEGVKYAEMKTDYPKFVAAVKEKFDQAPSAAVLTSYVAMKFVMQVVENDEESVTSGAALQKLLMSQKSITLPDVELEVKERIVQLPLVMRVIKDGRAVSEGS